MEKLWRRKGVERCLDNMDLARKVGLSILTMFEEGIFVTLTSVVASLLTVYLIVIEVRHWIPFFRCFFSWREALFTTKIHISFCNFGYYT